MRGAVAAALVVAAAWGIYPAVALAGSWATPKGRSQLIVKSEVMRAVEGFDPDGSLQPLPDTRREGAVSLFAEHGLTDRLTLQVKAAYEDGADAFVDYRGRGPVEIGVRWQAYRDDWSAVSVYVGHAWGGDGRNAAYAAPGVGDRDWEVRLLAGRAFGGGRHIWMADGGFVELQVARRFRDGLADETRVDATAGLDIAENWQVQTQMFAGLADSGGRWAHLETSVIRRLGPWSLQAGWRQTVLGREVAAARGPVLAVWRRF